MDPRETQLLFNEISEIFSNFPDARDYVIKHNNYVHFIDDIIDGDVTNNPDNILKLMHMACDLHSMPFHRQYGHVLFMLDTVINNSYADSVKWEKSEEDWKKKASDVIRHEALNTFFAVVFIIAGYDKMRKISSRMREFTHFRHLNDILNYGN